MNKTLGKAKGIAEMLDNVREVNTKLAGIAANLAAFAAEFRAFKNS